MAKALNVSLAVTADTSQAKAQLQQLQNTLQQLTANSANLNLGINANEIAAASKAALELSAHLKQATDINTGTLNFTKFESSIRHSGQTIEGLGSQLMSLGPQGQQAFSQLAQAVAKSEIPMKKISGMLGQFGTVISNTIRWQASSSIIHGIMGSIQGAYNYAQDLNKSLNNIQIVTQMSDTQMSKFADSANKAAKALSTTTTSYTDAALIYYQQGIRDQNEINERTSATIKMANVTGQSAQQVSNQMTAIWNNFSKGGENLEYYADVITALGAATASSSEEISKGLEKFAATADTVGLSYENATAALATITATTRQSADSVGTGLRTLFARLDSLKLGETLEDGVDLTKYTKALQSVGVQVLDTNGNLKRMDDILNELGEKWGDINDTQKVALAQTVGGVRQYTTLMALMNNFDFYKENVDIAKNSEGTLQRQQEVYEKSWAASSKRVRAAMETIFSTVISDQFFINLNNGFAQFLDIVNNVIKGLGGMKGLLLGLGGVLGQVFQPQITQGLYNFGMGMADIFTSGKASQETRKKTINNLAGIMGGGYYNPSTENVEGSNKVATGGYSRLLANQQRFSENAALMAPWQRSFVQMTLDKEQNAIEATRQASIEAADASSARARAQGAVYQQATTSKKITEERQKQIADAEAKINADKLNTYRQEADKQAKREADQAYSKTGKRQSDEETKKRAQDIYNARVTGQTQQQFLDKRNASLAADLKSYQDEVTKNAGELKGLEALNQNEDLQKRIAAGQLTDKEITQLKGKIGEENYNALAAGHASVTDLITQQAGRGINPDLLTKLETYGIDTKSDDFRDWANKAETEGAKRIAQKIKEAEEEEAHRAGEDAAGSSDKRVKTAENITKVATGLMQASAAGQSLQNVVGVFDQINSGSISASEGITQLATGLTTTATQGMMAFNSLSSVLGGFGGALATIAMITLPYIIDAFDGLFESDKERQERYAQYTELAQERLTNAKTSYQELLSGFESHDSLLDELSKLTKGTAEFEEALSKANTEAENLIDKYDLTQSAGDYYYDQNGAIQFSKRTQERLETEAKKEIADAETDVLQAQYTEALNKYQTNQDILDNMSAQYNRNSQLQAQGAGKSDKAFYAQYNELAKSLGYSSGEQLYQLYTGGKASEVQKANYFKSGVGKTYASMNRNKALSDDGLISDTEALQNTYLESQQAQHLEDVANLVPDRMVQIENMKKGWSNLIDLADVSWTHSLDHFEAAYESLAGTDKLARLQKDINYQQKSNKDKKIYLASLIQAEDQERKLQEIEDKYAIEWDQAKLKEFEGYKKKKGAASQKLRKEYNQAIKNVAEGKGTSADLTTLAMTQAMIQEQSEAVSNLAGIITSSTTASFNVQDFIEGLGNGTYSIEDIDTLSNYTAQFASNFGESSATAIFTSLKETLASNSTEFLDVLDKIDFSGSGITSLFDINQQLKDSAHLSADTKIKLQNLKDAITTDIGGKDGLFSELINSAEFSDTFKSLTKNVKDFGDITAQSVMDAADNCDILQEFLTLIGENADDAKINAQGLASALELISLGEIDASQVSAGLLAALSAAGQLDNQLASVYKHIDDYNQERSAADIGSFYQAREKDIHESLSKGIFADKPLLQSWQELFGVSGVGKYMDWAVETSGMGQKERQKSYNDKFAAEIKAMNSIYERGNLSGMYEYAFDQTSGKTLGNVNGTAISNKKGTIMTGEGSQQQKLMHYDDKTQQLVIDNMDQFKSMFTSMEDFGNFLETNLGMNHDMAQAMAAEVGQYNAEVQQHFKEQDIQAGKAALEKAAQEGNLTMDQIEAFQKKYAAFDKEMQASDWAQKFAEQCRLAGGSVIDMGDDFDYTNSNIKDLQDALGGDTELQNYLNSKGAQTGTGSIKDSEGSIIGSTKVTDLNNLQKALQSLGYTADQANNFISNNIDTFGALGFTARDATTGMISSMNTEDEAFQKWYATHKDGYDNMAQAVAGYQDEQNELYRAQQQASAIAEALGMQNFGATMEALSATIASLSEALAGLSEGKTEVEFGETGSETVITQAQAIAKNVAAIERNVVITYTSQDNTTAPAQRASGMNNTKGFAGGYHSNNDFQGIAETGELGPELWVHNGEPALTGVHGRNKIFVSEGDQIFTAAQTREILHDNPSLQNIPGYYDGIENNNTNTYGTGIDSRGGNTGGSGGGGGSSDKKSDDYDPERYHVISRQITALTRIFDRLTKAKENAYGTNILDAMDAEIEAQDKLIEKQKELIKEVEEYKKQDLKDLDKLKVKYELDENGNISNWDELQKKYEKKAQNGDEKAKKIWEAIQQYEETVDKLEEERDKLQEQIRKRAELELAKITTKAELKIKFDEKQIKLIEYQLDKISDNIYKSAEALALVGQHMDRITRSMSTTRDAIDDIFNKMADQDGNPISMTLEQFLAMSTAEQDALHINGEYGRQIEEYIEDLLSYNEELLEFKTKGVEQLAEAFDELTSKIEKSMDLFGYYNGILSTMKDIVELQNIKFPKELRSSVQDVSNALASVNEDNIVAQKEYYQVLSEEADNIREKLARTTDFDLQQQYQEQLDQLEEKMRTCMSDLTTLWQQGLQQAQDDLNRSLDWIVEDYETAIAGMYGNLSMLQEAFDREQKVRERYAEDYEKYYQLNKLQRTINKDLDKAAVNGYKANKNLAALLEHIQELQESGADVSAYDLELLQKRYEYYKALADLEDARNAKSQVRLQRDRNGNWTYVYTANEDELEDLQQAADDKLYELQKFVRESSDDLEKQIQDLVSNYTQQRVEMIKQGASAEALAEFDKYFEDQLAYLNGEWNKTLTDAGSTVDIANERYKIDSFDIIDTFGETISAQVSSAQSTEELMNTATNAMLTAAGAMDFAVNAYGDTIERLNTLLGGEGDFATNFQSFVASIQEASNINLGVTQEQIDNFKTTYKEVLDLADEFEKEFFEKFQAIIDKNEELIQQLTDALEKLNNIQQEQDDKKDDDKKKKKKKKKKDDDGSGSGSGGGGSGSGGGGGGGSSTKDEKVTYGAWSSWKSYGSSGHKRSRVKFVNGKQSGIDWQTGSHDQKKRVTTGNKIARYCTVCGYAWPLIDAPTSGGCFAPGTQILMADYTTKNIEDVLVGDYVVAYNEQTKAYEPKQVLYSFAHYNTQEIIDIYLSNNTILTATMCHPILTTEGWKSLNHDIALYEHEIETTPLNIGQIIVGYNEQYEIINIINRFDLYGSVTYNITIEEDHTYIANNCIVHNMAMQATQMKYDTGGYTGNWGSTEGKWAILHEKEQVFNKDDTAKLLMASKILQTIDIQARYASGAYNHLSSPSVGATEQNIQQEVKIEAQFPNATNHSEIEQAFNNLSNKAIQYANRKR